MEKLLMTKKEVCKFVGVAPASIDRYENHEDYRYLGFPRRFKIGFRVFWEAEAIRNWCASQIQIAKRAASK